MAATYTTQAVPAAADGEAQPPPRLALTYGEFAWKDLMRSALRDRSRAHDGPPTVFVPGQPVAAGHAGEARWSYKVQRAVRQRIGRPRLVFVVSPGARLRHGFSLRALAAPVAAAVAPEPRSLWAQVRTGDRCGVAVGAARPGFPPRIDRLAELATRLEPSALAELRAELAHLRPMLGDETLGLHVTLRADCVDLRDRTPLAVLLGALSPALGATARAGAARVDDLRVTADRRLECSAEVRIWSGGSRPGRG